MSRVGNLHYRDAFEYAVGHGVSTWARPKGQGEDVYCDEVGTTWLPTAKVEKVLPSKVKGVELRMEELGKELDAAAVHEALDKLVSEYDEWIKRQSETDLSRWPTQADTASGLLLAAGVARDRIRRGIEILATDSTATGRRWNRESRHGRRPDPARKAEEPGRGEGGEARPELASLPASLPLDERGVATGPQPPARHRRPHLLSDGRGKTEAYLGLAASHSRLTNPGLASAGVTVLMRYTLRLLTLDQLERAATSCARWSWSGARTCRSSGRSAFPSVFGSARARRRTASAPIRITTRPPR